MATFRELCAFPCLCRACTKIVTANLLDRPPICPDCQGDKVVPYDPEELCNERGEATVASWNISDRLGRELVLTDGRYYCPSCNSFGLRFQDAGLCWD